MSKTSPNVKPQFAVIRFSTLESHPPMFTAASNLKIHLNLKFSKMAKRDWKMLVGKNIEHILELLLDSLLQKWENRSIQKE